MDEIDARLFSEWYALRDQFKKGLHMSDGDISELLRLNMRLLEATHEIHNESMSKDSFKSNR